MTSDPLPETEMVSKSQTQARRSVQITPWGGGGGGGAGGTLLHNTVIDRTYVFATYYCCRLSGTSGRVSVMLFVRTRVRPARSFCPSALNILEGCLFFNDCLTNRLPTYLGGAFVNRISFDFQLLWILLHTQP